jgi:hypothetical protein
MVAYVEVECTHETLFGGMCGDCGKDLHLSSNKIELERASIRFDHSTNDITTTKKVNKLNYILKLSLNWQFL